MFHTIRRAVVAVPVASVITAGALVALGGAPASAAIVTTAGDQPVHVRLDQAETTAAAASLDAAKQICDQQVMPTALQFHTASELAFPVCQVVVQICAAKADASDEVAAVWIYEDHHVCGTWVLGSW